MNLMLLDEDDELARLLEGVLEADGMWVVQYRDPAEAVGAAVNGEWIAALVSLDLADGAAEAFLEVLGDLEDVKLPVVLTSTRREFEEEVQEVMSRFGQNLFLRKPIPLLDLNDMLRRAREGGVISGFGGGTTPPSISVDLQLSDVNEVSYSPDTANKSGTGGEGESARRQSMKGALGAVQRVREGIEELVELTDDDLVPVSILPEDLQPVDSLDGAEGAFLMEIEDDEDTV